MDKPKLTVELVPRPCWEKNVRAIVSKNKWRAISSAVSKAAGGKCEVCGGRGSKWPVECHEEWEYDDARHTQTLRKMVALCPHCHSVKHLGRAQMTGNGEEAMRHLRKVNGWSEEDADMYVREAFLVWFQRSSHDWTIDLSAIEELEG